MRKNENTRNLSKYLSYVLRHRPDELGIELDKQGWTDVAILLEKLAKKARSIDRTELDRIVVENDKQRFAFNLDKTKIRANQGHSISVDLAYDASEPPEYLYHGTSTLAENLILAEGIKKMNRHHVHLSSDKQTAAKVGQRHGQLVIFVVSSAEMHRNGIPFFLSENGVWLTDFVETKYLRKLD
jgi:putative RNA 2'-phosphotransferase